MSKRTDGPLDKFKRIQQSATSDDPLGIDAEHAYKAYDIGDRSQERLQIRRILNTTHAPSYRYLMDIMYNPNGTQIMLVYSFLLVKIRGKHLQRLTRCLEEGICIYIQDFHANEWKRPKDTEAIIEEIDVVVRQDGDMTLDKEKEEI